MSEADNNNADDHYELKSEQNKCRLFIEQKDESSLSIDDGMIGEIMDDILANNDLKKLTLDNLFKKVNQHLNDQFGPDGYRAPKRMAIMSMIQERFKRMNGNEQRAIQTESFSSRSTNVPSSSLMQGMILTHDKFSKSNDSSKNRKCCNQPNSVFRLTTPPVQKQSSIAGCSPGRKSEKKDDAKKKQKAVRFK